MGDNKPTLPSLRTTVLEGCYLKKIKTRMIPNVGEDVEKLELSYTVGI